jgi:hypothetical protein
MARFGCMGQSNRSLLREKVCGARLDGAGQESRNIRLALKETIDHFHYRRSAERCGRTTAERYGMRKCTGYRNPDQKKSGNSRHVGNDTQIHCESFLAPRMFALSLRLDGKRPTVHPSNSESVKDFCVPTHHAQSFEVSVSDQKKHGEVDFCSLSCIQPLLRVQGMYSLSMAHMCLNYPMGSFICVPVWQMFLRTGINDFMAMHLENPSTRNRISA